MDDPRVNTRALHECSPRVILRAIYHTLYHFYIIYNVSERKRGGRDWVFQGLPKENPVPPDSFPFTNIVYYIEVISTGRKWKKVIPFPPTSTGRK